MQNFRHFCKKKEKHLRSSLSMVLHSTLQLQNIRLKCPSLSKGTFFSRSFKRVNLSEEVENVEADRRVVECLGHFHRTRSQAFACAKMASAPKKLPDIAEHVFSKGQLELKTLNVFFLNQHLTIYHFTLF